MIVFIFVMYDGHSLFMMVDLPFWFKLALIGVQVFRYAVNLIVVYWLVVVVQLTEACAVDQSNQNPHRLQPQPLQKTNLTPKT